MTSVGGDESTQPSNRRKLNQKIARVHEQIAECRRDFHFNLAHHLCDKAGMIFVEDLDFRISGHFKNQKDLREWEQSQNMELP